MPKNTLPKIYAELTSRRFLSVSKAAKILQVSPDTLRNWEKQGKLIPERTRGGARRYNTLELLALRKQINPSLGSHKGLLSVSQAASQLRISADTLRSWTKKGLIDSQRTKGGARRFTRSELKRVQQELGIKPEAPKQVVQFTNIQPEIHKFSSPWKRVLSNTFIVVLIFIIALLVKLNIDAQSQKLGEAFDLIEKLAGTIESLQGQVFGIQTEEISPQLGPSLPPTLVNNISSPGIEVLSASNPISLSNNQIGCIDCLTISSDYIVAVKEEGGSLNIETKEKDVIISLDTTHTNTWTAPQNFNEGLNVERSNTLVLNEGESILYGIKSKASMTGVSSGGIQQSFAGYFTAEGENSGAATSFATGIYASASGADYNFAAIFKDGNVGIGTTTPIEGKLVIADNALTNQPALYIDTESSLPDADVFTIISSTTNGSGPNTTKFKITADGSVYSDSSIYSAPADLAEMYFAKDGVEEADMVELIASDIDEHMFMVQKAVKDSGNRVVGVISTKPGSVLGYDLSRLDLISQQKPVALAGRVAVKVSSENGQIEAGDYLTSSSTPGVAMKATTIGEVIGMSLESFSNEGVGQVMVYVNPTLADPGDFLASLSLDEGGNLIIPKLKVEQLVVSNELLVGGSELTTDGITIAYEDYYYEPITPNSQLFYDLSGKIASLEDRIAALEREVSEHSENSENQKVSESESQNVRNSDSSDTPIRRLSGYSEFSDLTPPDILLASGSAQLANINITSNANILGILTTYQAEIQDNFKVLGQTTLGNTLVAGDLVVDGTLTLGENSINAFGTLYLQNSPLASTVDFFNGGVTIDKDGHLRAGIVTVAEFRVVANKISGSGKIPAGSSSAQLKNELVKPTSRILITPTSNTNLVLAVTEKLEDQSFVVSSTKVPDEDLIFDWIIINESED